MQPAPPAALQLASRLKHLRQHQSRLTQAELAAAFAKEGKLASRHGLVMGKPQVAEAPACRPLAGLRAVFRHTPINRGTTEAASV